jgi:hypothetical protein
LLHANSTGCSEMRNNGEHYSVTSSVFIEVSKIYLRDLEPAGWRSALHYVTGRVVIPCPLTQRRPLKMEPQGTINYTSLFKCGRFIVLIYV